MRLQTFTLVLVVAAAGCATAPPPSPPPIAIAPGSGVVGAGSAGAIARADAVAAAYTPADVEFMSGMVPHHAQAVVMAGWCESHGARRDVNALCDRIVISQQDEIRLMRRWLMDRGEVAPDPTATRHVTRDGDTVREMLMPGMLTDEELAALDRARYSDFDRLFLEGMIVHHQGAIIMVERLFAQPGAGQQPTIFRFASDVLADQSGEIQRMLEMLETVP